MPAMSEKRAKDTTVRARVTQKEREAIEAAAAALGLSVSAYIRMALAKSGVLKAAGSSAPHPLARELAGWTAKIGKLSDRLGDLRTAVPGGVVMPPDVAEKILRFLRGLHADVLKAVGRGDGQ